MVEDLKTSRKLSSVTGRNVIEDYVSGKPLAMEKYKQLSKALLLFESWDDNSKIEFLSQFIDIYDLLDANCSEIVAQFCRLKWHLIPQSILRAFVEFLAATAVNHIVHVEMVYKAVTERFQPEMKKDPTNVMSKTVPALTDDVQEQIYEMAHHCANLIITCLPLSVHTLLKCCESGYPHYRHPTVQLLAYNRNLILLSEYHSAISKELWSLVIDRLIYLDASISAKKHNEEEMNPYDTEEIFAMDEDGAETSGENESDKNSVETKLDLSMCQIISYISSTHGLDSNFGRDLEHDIYFKWIETLAKRNLNLFQVMLTGFEEHVLYSFDIQSVSYLWFYLCGSSEENANAMLHYLWSLIKSPLRSPNDWKKAHNAAALLCGFLARANYISFKTACYWLKAMAQWCCSYVDNAGFMKVNVGGLQHGTFYATVQAVLFVICYRYKEFHGFEEVHLWGLGRIVHSQLEPLRFISQAVALCFANVSRFLQIVYCNHIVSPEESLRQRPVELYFPFSFCTMNLCSLKILPLMRKFSPIDDFDCVPSLKNKRCNELNDSSEDMHDYMGSIARSPLTQLSLSLTDC